MNRTFTQQPDSYDQLELLRRKARQLWNSAPSCSVELRTSLLIRLARLEYDLEGLHYSRLGGESLSAARLAEYDREMGILAGLWTGRLSALQPVAA